MKFSRRRAARAKAGILTTGFVLLISQGSQGFLGSPVHGDSGAAGDAAVPPASGATFSVRDTFIQNPYAYIAPQCYSLTSNVEGAVVNPCYVCHQVGKAPNYLDDSDFQLTYEMTEGALANPWSNLFEDRSARIAALADDAILDYVRTDNYFTPDGDPILANRLRALPADWDLERDGRWDGYLPDVDFQFDDQGFDRDPEGGYTGWRAFAYYPTPGTYWPTNGGASEVLIRLPDAFRRNAQGDFDPTLYALNLAIVEALVKRRDVVIDAVDESLYQTDLDRDGELGSATVVRYDWAPLEQRFMSFLGQAGQLQRDGKVHLAAGLFPEGTEFLQGLRYLDLDATGAVRPAARLKELRYARKKSWYNYSELKGIVDRENAERREYENNTIKQVPGDYERGLFAQGWAYQGFIEDRAGELRPQTQEETLSCMGCHSGLGATTDTTFAFVRKLDADAHRHGWYHWTQKDAAGLNEPKVEIAGAGVQFEYSYYLMYTRSGNEFLDNPELRERFFNQDGSPNAASFARLHDDIAQALNPSPARALALDKAYRTIVEDQDFVEGRDANLEPFQWVLPVVPKDLPTGIPRAASVAAFQGCFDSGGACEPDRAAVRDDWTTRVTGVGMAGPDGARYQVDWRGIIHFSSYALGIEGVGFTFPPRLTLPTRTIVPLKDIPVCYDCHRIAGPSVDAENRATLTVDPADRIGESVGEGKLQQLTSDGARDLGAKWSPDGRLIAFVSDRSGTEQVWLMDAAGGSARQLTPGPSKHAWPEWSPDGRRLAYWSFDPATSLHGIETIDVDGRNAHQIVTWSGHLDRPTWRPDGQFIALAAEVDGNWDLWLVRPDGSERRRLTQDPAMETNPLWSPDGSTLAYKVAPSGDYNLTIENFMTFEQGLDHPTVHVWNGPQAVQMNAWSPDGSQVAYTAEVINDASGEDRVTYVNIVSDLALKDGEAIAEPSVIVSQGQTLGDRGAVFSPTGGEQVAFWAWDKNYRTTLWLYDQATQAVRQLTTLGSDLYPQWSPDGKRLVFESGRGGNSDLWMLSLD
ncbi:hypothetical protein [uncultured Thiocystis sp.]|jgi:Tol biopolymer transport system component|uniref:hypothetical protein n=1 Tax=uncultured Thiocystis sp. TaxID=1202134 RepID=UPI0026012755|nr:hypothetical protein [uncultured Thiocystis sp.]